jgi:putative acetyltransferase
VTVIREERPGDCNAIRLVNEAAFGRTNEADLVEALRQNAQPCLSLVAIFDDLTVGHIFFSPVSIDCTDSCLDAMGLGPMAVLPEFQRTGIGSSLVERGLLQCVRMGFPVVVVLGHPQYYSRFGFVAAKIKGIRSEYCVPDDVFMVAELLPGALQGLSGVARYRPEFRNV